MKFRFVIFIVSSSLAILTLANSHGQVTFTAVILFLLAFIPWLGDSLESIRTLGFEAKFRQARKDVDSAAFGKAASENLPEVSIGRDDYLQPLGPGAENDPNVAIATFGREVERRLTDLAVELGLTTARRSASALLGDLTKQNLIDSETAAGLKQLVALRNQAVHGARVTKQAGSWALDRAPRILGVLDALISKARPQKSNAALHPGPPGASTIKVLSIDGGGIRGIIPALILAELEKRLGKELHRVFDLISGTSTGGVIALGVGTRSEGAGPYRPGELADMYIENGPDIFRRNFLTPLKALLRAKYSPQALEGILEEFFAETMFSTALTPLLISSYDIEAELPFFFKSHKILDRKDGEYDWRVRDIARAISATPTLFPPARLEKGGTTYNLVDGSLFTHAMTAFAEASRIYPIASRYVVISVGTGHRHDHHENPKAKKWGLLGWAVKIVPVFMDSVSMAADYTLVSIPSCQYFRLQPPNLGSASNAMDDASRSNVANLQSVARDYIKSADATLDVICDALKTGRGSTLTGTGLMP
jgi:patatin-like phospholipase